MYKKRFEFVRYQRKKIIMIKVVISIMTNSVKNTTIEVTKRLGNSNS